MRWCRNSSRSTRRWPRISTTEAAFTEIGRQFHDQVVRGCGNHTMIAVVGSLETLWSSHEQQWAEQAAPLGEYPSLSKRRAVLNTHVRLTEVIEAGDAPYMVSFDRRNRGSAVECDGSRREVSQQLAVAGLN